MDDHAAPAGTRLALIGLLAAIGLLIAACAAGSHDPRAASSGTSTTVTSAPSGSGSSGSGSSGSRPSEQARETEELRLAQCMRSHGVPNFPDPGSDGGLLHAISAAGINTRSTAYLTALQACKKYTPAGNVSPGQSAAQSANGLKFSQCMRSHGVPNFPDPSTGPTGGQVINLHGSGIDPSSPAFQAAKEACQKTVPGSK